MNRYVGVGLIVGTTLCAVLDMLFGRDPSAAVITAVLGGGILGGVALLVIDRLVEISGPLGTLRTTTEQAGQYLKEIEAIKRKAEELSKSVDDRLGGINQLLEFTRAVVSAQTDDRVAFDQLARWSQDDKYPLRHEAEQAWQTIVDSHCPAILEDPEPPRDLVTERGEPTISADEAISRFKGSPSPAERASLLELLRRSTGSAPDRFNQFLIEVAQTDKSLKVVTEAGRWLIWHSQNAMGYGPDQWYSPRRIPAKPLEVKKICEWWAANETKKLAASAEAVPRDVPHGQAERR